VSIGDRPDPDALLSSIQREEAAKKRGRLKIFLGMCPGVGKTYAMLEAAQRELKAGRDLVIGYVETHGRKETDALPQGLPAIPRRPVEYLGVTLTEMDLDAVLARKPRPGIFFAKEIFSRCASWRFGWRPNTSVRMFANFSRRATCPGRGKRASVCSWPSARVRCPNPWPAGRDQERCQRIARCRPVESRAGNAGRGIG